MVSIAAVSRLKVERNNEYMYLARQICFFVKKL